MEVLEAKRDRGSYFYRFHPKAAYCKGCGIRARCYRNVDTYKGFAVKKEYFDNLPMREMMTEKLSSAQGKKRMADRACLIEHVLRFSRGFFDRLIYYTQGTPT